MNTTGFSTLVSAAELFANLGSPDWAVVDCRFSLDNPGRGREAYRQAHTPGAVYAHLDEDLSGPILLGRSGRHPLPEVESFSHRLSQWGIDQGTQVVAYDDSGGSMAARLWWMLHWLGHPGTAVLDGGWPAWLESGYPVRGDAETRPERKFSPKTRPELLATAELVLAHLDDPSWRIVDARSPERFHGWHEPIDRLAGRIPGAGNLPHLETVAPDGRSLPPAILRTRFESILGGVPPEQAVFYCGSGVTAARDLLALAHAGLGEARLYAGSWSEWITDPERPIQQDPLVE